MLVNRQVSYPVLQEINFSQLGVLTYFTYYCSSVHAIRNTLCRSLKSQSTERPNSFSRNQRNTTGKGELGSCPGCALRLFGDLDFLRGRRVSTPENSLSKVGGFLYIVRVSNEGGGRRGCRTILYCVFFKRRKEQVRETVVDFIKHAPKRCMKTCAQSRPCL